MTSALHLFASLEVWSRVPDPERGRVVVELAGTMGPGWRAGRVRVGRHGLGSLVHEATGLTFVVVPGGWLRMGFSLDDLLAAASARKNAARNPWGPDVDRSRPARLVRIAPFLLAESGLPPEGDAAVAGDGSAGAAYRAAVEQARGEEGGGGDDAAGDDGDPPMRRVDPSPDRVRALVPPGLRMASEAELEWAFREGGTTRWVGIPGDVALTADNRWGMLGKLENGFGLRGFVDKQNVSGEAWSATEPQLVARSAHTYWQDDDAEMLGLHAANRYVPDEYGETILRLAADLPGAADVEVGAAPALAEDAAVLAALGGDDARGQGDALVALQLAARRPGDDLAATSARVMAQLATVAPALRAPLLVWLGDARARIDAGAVARWLSDEEPAVRAGAAHALVVGVGAVDALRARLAEETEPGVRAGIVLALAAAGEDVAPLAVDAVTRAAVAIGRAERGDVDIDGLVAALDLDAVPHLAYAGGDLGRAAIAHVVKLEGEPRERAAIALATRAARIGDGQLAGTATWLAFGHGERGGVAPPRGPQEVTPAQRAVAAALIPSKLVGFAEHGLPTGFLGLRRWAGLAPASPCERMVTAGETTRPLWCALLAASDATAMLDALDPVTRLALFLERFEYGLGRTSLRQWKLDPTLAAAMAADPAGARAAVDAAVAARLTHGGGSAELLAAVVATRPAAELDPACLALLDFPALGRAARSLRAFPASDTERRVLELARAEVAAALASDGWSLGADTRAEQAAPALASVPLPELARALLYLGWAGGQPASVREKLGELVGDHAALAEVLAQYDELPGDMSSWSEARARLRALPGW